MYARRSKITLFTAVLCGLALGAGLGGCATPDDAPEVVDGKMSFVVVEASGGG